MKSVTFSKQEDLAILRRAEKPTPSWWVGTLALPSFELKWKGINTERTAKP